MKDKKIRIIKIDSKEGVPEWGLEAWEGMELYYECYFSKSKLTGHISNIVTGTVQVANQGGYLVNAKDAFERLKDKNLKVFDWYQSNSFMFVKKELQPGWNLIFYRSNCERI